MDRRDRKRRDPLRQGGERRRLLRPAGRRMVPSLRRPPGAGGGDEPPVFPHRGDPRARRLEPRDGPQAAAPARRRHLLLPASGETRAQPRPLRAQLPRPLGQPRRPLPRRLQLSALPRRPRPAGALYRGCDGAGAAARDRRRLARHQRPDPLCTRRAAAPRPDARCRERLRGPQLHLRHRPGRRCGQGHGRMDRPRRDRVGHVGLRPAPLHRVCRSRLHARQGHRDLRP